MVICTKDKPTDVKVQNKNFAELGWLSSRNFLKDGKIYCNINFSVGLHQILGGEAKVTERGKLLQEGAASPPPVVKASRRKSRKTVRGCAFVPNWPTGG